VLFLVFVPEFVLLCLERKHNIYFFQIVLEEIQTNKYCLASRALSNIVLMRKKILAIYRFFS